MGRIGRGLLVVVAVHEARLRLGRSRAQAGTAAIAGRLGAGLDLAPGQIQQIWRSPQSTTRSRSGPISTFLPGSQLRVSIARWRIVQLASSIKDPRHGRYRRRSPRRSSRPLARAAQRRISALAHGGGELARIGSSCAGAGGGPSRPHRCQPGRGRALPVGRPVVVAMQQLLMLARERLQVVEGRAVLDLARGQGGRDRAARLDHPYRRRRQQHLAADSQPPASTTR